MKCLQAKLDIGGRLAEIALNKKFVSITLKSKKNDSIKEK